LRSLCNCIRFSRPIKIIYFEYVPAGKDGIVINVILRTEKVRTEKEILNICKKLESGSFSRYSVIIHPMIQAMLQIQEGSAKIILPSLRDIRKRRL
jgi:hypothetical protein